MVTPFTVWCSEEGRGHFEVMTMVMMMVNDRQLEGSDASY